MKKIIGVLVFLCVLAGLGYTGSAYWLGMKTESRYQDMMLNIPQSPFFKVSTPVYRRGVFTSTAVSSLELFMPQTGESEKTPQPRSFRLNVSHKIWHGPFACEILPDETSYRTEPMLAFFETTLAIPTDSLPKVPELVDIVKKTTLTAHTTIALDGTGTTTMKIPAWQKKMTTAGKEINIKWKGLTGQSAYTPDLIGVRGKITMPGLAMNGERGDFSFTGLGIEMNTKPSPSGLSTGTAAFGLKRLNFTDSKPEKETNFSLADLKVTSNTTEKSALINSSQKLRIDHILYNNLKHGPFSYEIELRNLDAPTLVKLNEKLRIIQMQAINNPDHNPDPLLLADLGQLMPEFLKKSPVLELKELSIKTREGDFTGKAMFGFDGTNEAAMANPILMLMAMKLDAAASASEHLVARLLKGMIRAELKKQYKKQGELISDFELDRMASRESRTQLKALKDRGFIRHEQDRFKAEVHFSEGTLYLNEIAFPLDSLLQMAMN